MDDISSRLSEILSDPASMERLRNLAAMFSGTSQQENEPQQAPPPQNTQRAQPQPQGQMPSLDPQVMGLVMKLAPVLSAMRQEDNSTRLLNALRPFLGETAAEGLTKPCESCSLPEFCPT
jgi:hypothetical protein